MTCLSVSDSSVDLGRREIIRSVSFDLAAGEVVALLGPNGAGKSTLMRALAGVIPYRGSVTYSGQEIAAMSAAERAHAIAFLPQQRLIHWPLSIGDLVLLGRLPHRRFGVAPMPEDRAAANAAMETMQIEALSERPANEVSGGELARALVARAIAQGTDIIIADEPAAGLDPAHQIRLMSAFRSLAKRGHTIFLSLHDIELAARWSDRVILISDGEIAAMGPPGEAVTDSVLAAVYGVTARIGHDETGMTLTTLGLAET